MVVDPAMVVVVVHGFVVPVPGDAVDEPGFVVEDDEQPSRGMVVVVVVGAGGGMYGVSGGIGGCR